MKKLKSIAKKLANLDLQGYTEGRANHSDMNDEIEAMADVRARICMDCEMNVEEPIDDLKVKDRIPVISERMCDACGCSLPYLLRQNQKHCTLKKW